MLKNYQVTWKPNQRLSFVTRNSRPHHPTKSWNITLTILDALGIRGVVFTHFATQYIATS